ncbi:DEAD/DEAH box helicase family protein [Candidatus Woesearchaeota archaeon]|nr:DEAD/DEAH box helicase family protein [Candidatus Woesearchaeota archaeon]
MSILFPHPEVRPVQQQLIQDIADALEKKQNLLAHAPTGLGKTASVLSVTIPYALEHGLTVFFLTNRHTQHKIAVETLALMKQKHDVDFTVADLIGKKWMCLQEGVEHMYQSDFAEFCKAMREHNTCNFYQKLYRSAQLSPDAQRAQHELAKKTSSADEVKSVCAAHGICPYYFASELAKDADVIIADYYNLFHPEVQQSFFSRIGKKLEESIIIVDEAHNLPERIRAVMSRKLSGTTIKYALSEAKKFSPDIIHSLQSVHHALHELSVHAPKVVRTEQFVSAIKDYASVADKCVVIGDAVRETEKRSFIGSIGEFLESWSGSDDGYVRYIETFNKEPYVTLHLSCLDAAMVSAPILFLSFLKQRQNLRCATVRCMMKSLRCASASLLRFVANARCSFRAMKSVHK